MVTKSNLFDLMVICLTEKKQGKKTRTNFEDGSNCWYFNFIFLNAAFLTVSPHILYAQQVFVSEVSHSLLKLVI